MPPKINRTRVADTEEGQNIEGQPAAKHPKLSSQNERRDASTSQTLDSPTKDKAVINVNAPIVVDWHAFINKTAVNLFTESNVSFAMRH